MNYLSALSYTLHVTAPVFVIVFVGFVLKRVGIIDTHFVTKASDLVFKVCLPVLIFLSMLDNDLDLTTQAPLVLFSVCAAVISFWLLWLLSRRWVPHADRGVVVQGAFRSNLGIIGIALCAKAFGQPGLTIGAILLAVVTPVFNILSVFALNRSIQPDKTINWGKTIGDILKNPLIIAIILGFLCNGLDLKLPKVMYDASQYLARMTLPLALLAIGGSVSFSELKSTSTLSFMAVCSKLVVIPMAIGAAAYYAGFSGVALGCILLMFASPTAAASFVMVKSMGGNAQLASNIVAVSTLFSMFTISFLLYLAKVLAWI